MGVDSGSGSGIMGIFVPIGTLSSVAGIIIVGSSYIWTRGDLGYYNNFVCNFTYIWSWGVELGVGFGLWVVQQRMLEIWV